MATPSEKHERHCAKRYLEYTETPFYRAFKGGLPDLYTEAKE